MSFWKAITQDVIPSAVDVNSSNTNLKKSPDSGYQFLGQAESTLGVAAIQVTLKTDQNCTVTIEQSPDNAPTSGAPHWDIVDTSYYYAGQNFGRTYQAVNSYYRVTVTNMSTASDTTYFRLQTCLCPIVEAVPRALNSFGYNKNGTFLNDIVTDSTNNPYLTPWKRIGYTSVMNSTQSDIWSGTGVYVPPAAEVQMRVLSSSANDINTTGSGAQVVTIYYLNANYVEKTTTVNMNGTSAVNVTPTDLFRINDFRITTAGAGNAAAGNIQLQLTAGPNTVYGYITAGFTEGRSSVYTVPAGKTLYITKVNAGFGWTTAGANTVSYARIFTRATVNDQTGVGNQTGLFYPFHEYTVSNGSVIADLNMPTKIPEKCTWKISGVSSNATSNTATCVARGYLVG